MSVTEVLSVPAPGFRVSTLSAPRAHRLSAVPRQRHDRFEEEGLALLAAGRPAELAEMVRASGRRDLVADLLLADARTRQLATGVPELQILVERASEASDGRAGGTSRLRAWSQAMLAERLILDGEVASLVVARHTLDELCEQEPPLLPPLALRYARARLHRIVSGSWLMVPAPSGLSEHLRMRDEAISELISCGFMGEVHVTRGVSAGLLATVLFEDICENHDRLLDARAALGEDDESMWAPVLDYFLSQSSFETGDMTGALAAYDRIERSRFRHHRIDVLPRYGRSFFRLITAGASDVTIAAIERALADVRRNDRRVVQYWHGHVAHTLADMGSPATAHFARLEADLPALDTTGRTDRRILEMRVAALNAEPVATDEVLGALEAVAGFGHGRRAARTAVRISHDLAGAGDHDGAATVYRWGADRLPPKKRRTMWERWWCRQVDGATGRVAPAFGSSERSGRVSGPAPASASGLDIRVLAPTVEVERDGRPVALSDTQAKLLLALVIAYPAPMHVEQVSDVLWPDEDMVATRSRLNSLVHRLRRVLGPHGGAIGRSGGVLSLDGEHCQVDLWRFRRALAGDEGQRRQALLMVRGNLGAMQFPYDEAFVDERHRLTGEWIGQAGRARRAGDVTTAELKAALGALSLSVEDLEVMAR